MGGTPIGDRWFVTGRLYRSGTLAQLTAKGREQLTALGIKQVIDLRSVDEAKTSPSQLPNGVKTLHLPIKDPNRFPKARAFWTVLVKRERLETVLIDGYTRVMIGSNGDQIGRALKAIAAEPGATLVHCTAGKDRTGLLIAILLRMLGATDNVVLQDYLASNRCIEQIEELVAHDLSRLRRIGLTEEQIRPILATSSTTLETAFDFLANNYGTLNNYLDSQANFRHEDRTRLRTLLLKSSG